MIWILIVFTNAKRTWYAKHTLTKSYTHDIIYFPCDRNAMSMLAIYAVYIHHEDAGNMIERNG